MSLIWLIGYTYKYQYRIVVSFIIVFQSWKKKSLGVGEH